MIRTTPEPAEALTATAAGGLPGHRLRFGLPQILLLSALGVLVIAIAYAAGRSGRSWAEPLYWCGDVLVFLPLAVWVLAPGTPHKAGAVVAQAAFQAFVRWMYSPAMFEFPDELQHRRTAEDILHHHALFTPSTALPVSPQFPGLEEITTGLMSVTGLGLHPAGVLVVSIAHVALSAAIFLVVCNFVSERIAAAAALIFAVNPQHAFFNGLFVYEAVAFVFMGVALMVALRPVFRSRVELPLALVCLAAVAVTHHVTSAVTVLVFLGLGLALCVTRDTRAKGVRLLGLGGAGAAMLAAWIVFVAPATYSYLSGPVSSVISGFLNEGSVKGRNELVHHASPLTTAATLVGTGTMAVLVIAGFVLAWRRQVDPLVRIFGVAALGFFAVLGIRVLASDGAELSGRLLTYEYLFAGVAAAITVTGAWAKRRPWGAVVGVVAVVAVFIGNATSGWPAPYEVVPGKFHVDAFESGVTPAGVQAAKWIGANLPPHATVACDRTTCSLVGGYGTQDARADIPALFYAPAFDEPTEALIPDNGVDYVVTDDRLGSQQPITGRYFDQETAAQKRAIPFPRAALEKFAHVRRVDRVYDGGPVVIYDVRRLDG